MCPGAGVEIGPEQELTDDQIKYLHERAEARRKVWADHAAEQAAISAQSAPSPTESPSNKDN